MTLDLNPQGKKMILSIDGGGMRGAISVAMLAELEVLTGKPAYELFDMVVGTSTGAIIAAGLGVGLSAAELLERVYRDKLRDAFASQPSGLLKWLRFALRGMRNLYDWQPFLDSLTPLVEGYKVRDLQKPIVMMTTKDVRTGTTYYIVSKGQGASAFADWPVTGAVAASGAAPIYFPPVRGNLIDGGVGTYGNPCLAAATEAMQYIGASEGFTDGSVTLISLGTGYPPIENAEGAAARFWLADWLGYVIIAGIYDSSLDQAFNTRAIYRDRIDFRRYNPLLTRDNLREAFGIANPAVDPASLTLDSSKVEEVALMEQIGRAYARAIDWAKADVMPWDTPGGQPKPRVQPTTWDTGEYR